MTLASSLVGVVASVLEMYYLFRNCSDYASRSSLVKPSGSEQLKHQDFKSYPQKLRCGNIKQSQEIEICEIRSDDCGRYIEMEGVMRKTKPHSVNLLSTSSTRFIDEI